MIKKQSDDPDVEHAAKKAQSIIQDVLTNLPKAESFDYGGHELNIGEYEVCDTCTSSIAEAQQANLALIERAEQEEDPVLLWSLRQTRNRKGCARSALGYTSRQHY